MIASSNLGHNFSLIAGMKTLYTIIFPSAGSKFGILVGGFWRNGVWSVSNYSNVNETTTSSSQYLLTSAASSSQNTTQSGCGS